MARDYLGELGLLPRDLMTRPEAWQKIKPLGKLYYVYILWSLDGASISPIYVGKGTGRRFANHLAPSVSRQNNLLKARTIERLRSIGASFAFSFPAIGITEAEAHRIERDFVRVIGRLQTDQGPLTNLTEGGDGMVGLSATSGLASARLRPLFVDGQRFPGLVIAVQETGLAKGAILSRIQNGWPGYYFVDVGPQPCRKRGMKKHSRERAVEAAGVRYDRLSDAAAALGVHPPCVVRRIRHGWPGYFYLDQGQQSRARPPRGSADHMRAARERRSNTPRPVVVDGVRHENLSQAARMNGTTAATIRSWASNPDNPRAGFTD